MHGPHKLTYLTEDGCAWEMLTVPHHCACPRWRTETAILNSAGQCSTNWPRATMARIELLVTQTTQIFTCCIKWNSALHAALPSFLQKAPGTPNTTRELHDTLHTFMSSYVRNSNVWQISNNIVIREAESFWRCRTVCNEAAKLMPGRKRLYDRMHPKHEDGRWQWHLQIQSIANSSCFVSFSLSC